MKSTGIVRPVDALGRIVIPIELRRSLDINTDDSLEVFVQDDFIMLKKFEARCVFCGSDYIIAYLPIFKTKFFIAYLKLELPLMLRLASST